MLVAIADPAQNIDVLIGKYEVTVAEFTRFVNATDYKVAGNGYLYNAKHLPFDQDGSGLELHYR
ncbi:hypothetical protein [Thalassomonas sp. RHCl1]|uniref:hypothetical protein n=1 Tax=Thalassomonas sp. RHCl1 TaxID=2995320 RepID=UPI00248AE947|nr:hypothetical protein [Thalassomonas sp. RHCl1]